MATILVVDDQPTDREAVVRLLGYRGHRVLEAADGLEALALVRAERPEVVICDILMPTMDGHEFVRQLRAQRESASTSVIYFTAPYHEREAQALAQAVGVSSVLTKPCDAEVIILQVDEVLRPALRRAPAAPRGDALSNSVDELRIANLRLNALVELNIKLVSERDPMRLLDAVCRGARDLIGARYGALGILEHPHGDTRHFVVSGMPAERATQFGRPVPDAGALGAVLEHRRAMRWRDGDKWASGLPHGFPPAASLLAAPIASISEVYGWICLADKLGAVEFSTDDEALLTTLAALAGRSYENGNFYDNVQSRAAGQLQEMSRRLAQVQESERRELSRELHDRVGQNLTALGINLAILKRQVPDGGRAEIHSRFDDSVALVEATADAIDDVMAELRPPMLDNQGLQPALQWYANEFSRRTGIKVSVSGEGSAHRLEQEVEITLFRVVQEALNNVAKHARAGHVEIELDQSAAQTTLIVSDDGVGFDPEIAPVPGRGIATMRERAQSVGGHFEVRSIENGGARITIRIAG
jgi:signal transduction histidine kinase/DNA-binding response OmpR family regulator